MKGKKRTAEALVVGGGPVGLFSAVALHDRDVEVQVVDAEWERPVRGHACGLHPATLRAFDEAGLIPALLPVSHRIDRLAIYTGAERVGVVDFAQLNRSIPYVLALRQSDLEDVLASALSRRNVSTLWRQEVTELTPFDGGVQVSARQKSLVSTGEFASRSEQLAESLKRTQADYVIGADGFHSACREAAGSEMINLQQGAAFMVCEFMADLSGWEHEARLVLAPDSVSAFWPLGPELGRWTFQLWEGLDEPPSLERLRCLVAERAPWFAPVAEQLCWGAVSYFEQLLATRFGSDRLWLAGDAAHATWPLGFQSMNRGFCEARELSALIAAELHGEEVRPDRFADYQRRQLDEWRRLFGIRTRLGGRAALAGVGARLVSCLPATGADLDRALAQLGLHLESGGTPIACRSGYDGHGANAGHGVHAR